MPELEIVNVVATADLKQRVNLIQVSQLDDITHDQEIYGGRVAYLKTPDMYGKVTIFPSGKLISVGAKSPEQAQQDLETTVETLATGGLINSIKVEAELRNIVAVQRARAEHSNLIILNTSFRDDFFKILEVFLVNGWSNAIQLVINLDSIYR